MIFTQTRTAPTFFIFSLCIAFFSGCSSTSPNTHRNMGKDVVFQGQTLNDLAYIDIDIPITAKTKAPTIEDSMRNFEQASKEFSSDDNQINSLKEMADLNMASVELGFDVTSQAKGMDTTEHAINTTELTEKQNTQKFKQAISLYEKILARSTDPKTRIKSYYNLAKAQDSIGEYEQSIKTLKTLVKKYPQSPYNIESNFRLGDYYFSEAQFKSAITAYTQALDKKEDNFYYRHALYKKAWSEYKLNNYENSLADFFTLYEFMLPKEESKSNSRLTSEAAKGISLNFFYMDGAQSLTEYFTAHPQKPYEAEIYKNLAQFYIGKKRYNDAAHVYKTYSQNNPNSDKAPQFAQLQIGIFQLTGDIPAIIKAKKQFVTAFGEGSKFWQSNNERRSTYHDLLTTNLIDLAQYYHATAQKDKDIANFKRANKWYAAYLNLADDSDKTLGIRQQYAESLYSAEDYQTAITEFSQLAYQGQYKNADQMGYAALLAREKYIASLNDAVEITTNKNKKISEQLQFAKHFPTHKEVGTVLVNAVQESLKIQPLTQTISIAQHLADTPNASRKQKRYAQETIANAYYDLENFAQAETLYSALLKTSQQQEATDFYSDRLARSIYRQAETGLASEQATLSDEQLKFTTQKLLAIVNLNTQSEVRPVAMFDLANLYAQQEKWGATINVLQLFNSEYPTHALSKTVPDKLAMAYEKSGQLSLAAEQYLAINQQATLANDSELAKQALLKAASLFEKDNNYSETQNTYKLYIKLPQLALNDKAEATNKLALLNKKIENANQYKFWLEELIILHKNAGQQGTDRTAFLAADAGFKLALPHFENFKNTKITFPLSQSIDIKKDYMVNAITLYKEVLETRVPEYVTAARYKIGKIYHIFAQDLIDSERPKELDELALEEYEILLEDEALPLEDDAITFYEDNTKLTTQHLYDKWIKQSYKELADIIPARYNKPEQSGGFIRIVY